MKPVLQHEESAYQQSDPMDHLTHPTIYARPLPLIVDALSRHTDIFSLHENLPDMAEIPVESHSDFQSH